VTISSGGVAAATSASFQLSATVGQAAVGPVTGPTYEASLGHWGATAPDAGIAGDFDGDGDVDVGDFGVFALCFGGPLNPPAASCPAGIDADLDGDGDVDLGDFGIFATNFTGTL